MARKVVTMTVGEYETEWFGTAGERDMIDVNVYHEGKLILEWRYGRVAGSSIVGNAAFWKEQVILQAKAAQREAKDKANA